MQITSAPLSEYKTARGGTLKAPANYPSVVYQGERVYFCTRACLRVFEKNPDLLMSGDVEHPLDDDS